MSERIDAAILMRVSAERLRRIARIPTSHSRELLQIADDLEEQARKLEGTLIPERDPKSEA
jgi:hypothetical protein